MFRWILYDWDQTVLALRTRIIWQDGMSYFPNLELMAKFKIRIGTKLKEKWLRLAKILLF
ncbi:hypothetical protein AWI32_12880 [Enterobacter bugandensis]|nr:hypothetical protein ABF56_21435 [Enterobacter hormaechei subsp. steigerwaltii]KUR00242.1 hypothetical protein AWI32_12880 [Enterobacter bugandensis]